MIPPDRWPEADAIIDDLLSLPPEERRPALDARTGLDAAMRRAVAAVLAEADGADPFLDPADVVKRPLVGDLVERFAASQDDILEAGGTFAGYEVIGLVGRGGMGEVYRARDPRLGRDVALKVLPRDFEDDGERAARFEREARVLAALSHPNIASIYGIAEEHDTKALVLEYVDGPTLAERIGAGGVSQDEVMAWTRQVALAVEAAHARGVVHRDLKPANIKCAAGGGIKVLDFGLAKGVSGAARSHVVDSLTARWRPEGGVLGTPAYMAPEQVLGEAADERSDAWALGCMLYEMLTGRRPFRADTTEELLAGIVTRAPDLSALPAATAAWLRDLVTGLLHKDPSQRRSISDAVAALERPGASSTAAQARFRFAALLLAGVLIVGAAGFLGVVWWGAPAAGPGPLRLAVPIPASDALLLSGQQVAAISPDGLTVVYRAARQGRVHLFVRALDSADARILPGTQNAAAPFFSPDGQWVGFDGDGELRKVRLDGGPPAVICQARGGASATWASGVIVFATPTTRVLSLVSESGGQPQAITALDRDRGDLVHASPYLLSGGDAVLFTIATAAARHVAVLDLTTRAVRVLIEGAQPRVAGGHLLFVREDTLWGVPFDERRRELRGDASPLLNRLDTAGGNAVHFDVSASGTLIYVPRREEVTDRRLAWVDRDGHEQFLPLEPKRYQRATLSPDGRRVAVALTEGDTTDIWIGDVVQGTLTRVTRAPVTNTAPLWTPDGAAIVFRSEEDGGGLFMTRLDRPGETQRLTASPQSLHTPHGWTPDGRTLLFTEFRSYTEQVIASVGSSGGEPRLLLAGPGAQLRPQVAPDGRWVAYQSDESGRYEIYLRPFPVVDGQPRKVSADGGTSPRWTRNGRELVYYDGRGIMLVPIGPGGGGLEIGAATRAFDYAPFGGRVGPDFDVTPDGTRFLMIRPAEDTPASRAQLVLIQHWTQELRASASR